MFRTILIASALYLGLGPAAMAACKGQTGTSIFEDTFSDDSGGWELTQGVEIVPPALLLTASPSTASTLNLTFNAVSGDYCATFKLPTPPADNRVGAGLFFWAKDYKNLMLFIIYTDKTVGLYKSTEGAWTTVYSAAGVAGVGTGPSALNTMRVIAKDGKITLLLNDAQLKVVRAQIPTGSLRFGAYTEIQKPADSAPAVEVTSYAVTSVN